MPFSIARQQGRFVLTLAGAVTIRDAQDLAAKLLGEVLEDGASVGVDTEGLEDIDTCILQLLCSLRKTVREFSFDRPSEVLIGSSDRCGLRRDLLNAPEDL
jgi:anti-anti-sigma regulatory factor